MTAYYNEIDPKKAEWLRILIAAGHIAKGVVDERPIQDILPSDLDGFIQCHFFAGIGVWSYALRLAGWPDDRPVWTGSCPCQSFSLAGKGEGFDDKRHLWPAWYWLIQQCRPHVIFGEQVANGIAKAWLDLVCTDLENDAFTVGTISAAAGGFGAPHARMRTYFVADTRSERRQQNAGGARSNENANGRGPNSNNQPASRREVCGMADGSNSRLEIIGQQPTREERATSFRGRAAFSMDNAEIQRYDRRRSEQTSNITPTQPERSSKTFWSDCDWLYCRDGKYRPVESGTFPLAHGSPERVVRLRGYGDAIVAPQAAEFIKAYKEVTA